ncbi:MAG: helix-turn-helix domain-containing protein [Anaerolineae bacterium]|jgi:excisionase family DNA binding protein|nr:helix-turn-helix domain-containing protein [Anaerolineae bacterium]
MLDLSPYVEVSQAARELAVHPETVRRLLRQGELPGAKVGTLWLIERSVLESFKAAYDPRPGARCREEVNHDRS